jgi:hypothetical protein
LPLLHSWLRLYLRFMPNVIKCRIITDLWGDITRQMSVIDVPQHKQ